MLKRYIKLLLWRRTIRIGDHVMIKISKGVYQKMRVVLHPTNNEITAFNSRELQYENYKINKVYPYTETPAK